jgi:hypothetical protein
MLTYKLRPLRRKREVGQLPRRARLGTWQASEWADDSGICRVRVPAIRRYERRSFDGCAKPPAFLSRWCEPILPLVQQLRRTEPGTT